MDQDRFAELTKSLVTTSPRRRLLGALAGGTLGLVLGKAALVEDAEAAKKKKRANKKNRCLKKNRICEPFKSGKCCSERCCPGLGKDSNKSVCAPDNATQCCDPIDGGGYCERVNGVPFRKCCPVTEQNPTGYCCRTSQHACCPANSLVETDYCCPPGSTCSDDPETLGCIEIESLSGSGLRAAGRPQPERMQPKGR